MNQASEAQIQKQLVQTPEAQERLRQRTLRRITFGLGLILALSLFLLWLPVASRNALINSLSANRLLIGLLSLFGLVAVSLLWSTGQRLDAWIFGRLNLRRYHSGWMDRLTWSATQIGTLQFAGIVVIITYLLVDHQFAFELTLGSLTLLLLVTVLKALTDRARPFNLLRDTQVIGYREPTLSFPSGHTAQTFFMMTLAISYFDLPLGTTAVLYGLAVLVAFSRVYLGVHYPRDVIAGAILGVIWGILGVSVVPYL